MSSSLSFAELLARRLANLHTELAAAHETAVRDLRDCSARAQTCPSNLPAALPEVLPGEGLAKGEHDWRADALPSEAGGPRQLEVSSGEQAETRSTPAANVPAVQTPLRASKMVLAARSVMAGQSKLIDSSLLRVVPAVPERPPPSLPAAVVDEAGPVLSVQLALPSLADAAQPQKAAIGSGAGGRRWSVVLDAAATAARRPSMRGGGIMAVNFSKKNEPLEPWPAWSEIAQDDNSSTGSSQQEKHFVELRRASASEKLRLHSKSRDFHKIDRSSKLMTRLQALVIHPSSPRRLAWILAGIFLITFDVITVPLYAFSLPNTSAFLSIMIFFGCLYWTSDFAASFLVGFHYPGTLELELRPKITAKKYATTWAVVDAALVLLEWYITLVNLSGSREKQGVSAARATRSMRMVRTLRTVRLVRCAKVPGILKEVAVLIGRSETTGLLGGISKHFCVILLINHLIACLWFNIGKAMGPEGWVAYYVTSDVDLLNDWRYQYLTSLHWSLTQFTPATMAVQPQNLAERFFAVVVLLFAMITFSSFVSSITNMMTHLRSLKTGEIKQFAKLERYLHDNKISFHLTLRVRRYLEHSIAEHKHKPNESDVEMLVRLSEPLRMELHYEVYSPCLTKHPFFLHYSSMNLLAMQRLCHTALKTQHLSADDILFSRGEAAKCMYFVLSGCLEYVQTINYNHSSHELLPGHWACEMCLWTPWEHRGQMRAATSTSLLCLDSGAFHGGVFESREGQSEAASYACQAVQTVNDFAEPSEFSDIDTAWFNPEVICSQVFRNTTVVNDSGKPTLHFSWTKDLTRAFRPSQTNNNLGGNMRSSQNSTCSVSSIPEGNPTAP